jgi:hypothetical protein
MTNQELIKELSDIINEVQLFTKKLEIIRAQLPKAFDKSFAAGQWDIYGRVVDQANEELCRTGPACSENGILGLKS